MGEPIKAERIGKHFAAVVSPTLASTPFGDRQVPSVPAVSFANAVGVAERTYGNSANLFLNYSTAIDNGNTFTPLEFLPDNPVEGGFATSHGHMGIISGKDYKACPGAINCGVLQGPDANCAADFEGLLEALAERMANEFKSSAWDFYQNYCTGHDEAMAALLEEKASSWWDTVKGWGSSIADAAVSVYDYVTETSVGDMLDDAGNAANAAYEGAKEIISDVKDVLSELSELTLDEIKEIVKDWLREMLDDLVCSARDLLAEMLADPKPIAQQMGEAIGAAKIHVLETAAVVVVTRGAGGAASKLGQLASKGGRQIGALFDRLKTAARNPARRGNNKPSATPAPTTKPQGGNNRDRGSSNDNDSIKGDRNGKPVVPCLNCNNAGKPVNAIFGIKILDSEQDLDFVLEAPLPLVWQRTYVSSNDHQGWLGQGWSVPLGFRLEICEHELFFVDTQDRRTQFPLLEIGARFFSRYEHTTLKRNRRNQYELITPDGLRLVFGLGPRDQARLAAREADEKKRLEREQRAWQALLDERAERGEAPLPEPLPQTPAPQADTLVLLGIIDANSNYLRLHYDRDGLPARLDTSSGRRVAFLFDHTAAAQPRLAEIAELFDETGRQRKTLVRYCYSAAGDLVEVRDGAGELCRGFAYQNHIMVEHAEPGGLVSRYEWDQHTPKGKVLKNTLPDGQFWQFDYHPADHYTRVTDATGRTTVYHFNADYHLTAQIDALGQTTHFERDQWGNVIAQIDPAGNVTRYQYDGTGRLLRVTQPDGESWRIAWHAVLRKPISVTDPLGRITRYAYDERGNLTETSEPDGAVTTYRVDARGLIAALTDARGGIRHFEYDSAARLISSTDCSGKRSGFEYDHQGNLISHTDALGHTTTYAYRDINRRARLSLINQPDGAEERFAYDALGRLVAHHDPLGRVTRYRLDAEGRPLERVDALGHRLQYGYDLHGRLLSLTNENGAVYRFAWDPLDRLLAEQGFDGRRIDYRYDAAGALIESADGVPTGVAHMGRGAAGIVRTRLARDAMGRLTDKIAVKPGEAKPVIAHSRYTYDAAGQLVRARNRHARVDLYYTLGGRLAREETRGRGAQLTTLRHNYDLLGNRIATILPDGRTLNTLAYGSGHVHQINLDHETLCDFERDDLHREISRTQGALATDYTLDAMGRLLQSAVRQLDRDMPLSGADERSQGRLIARRYQYDAAGQLLDIADARQGLTRYTYDAVGRLTRALAPQGEERFAFDPAHNLVMLGQNGDPTTADARREWTQEQWAEYVRDNLADSDFNPLHAPADAASDPAAWGESKPNRLMIWQEHRYQYDTWGNCIEKKSGAHIVRHFEWDAEHRLSNLTVIRQQGRFTHTERWGYDYDPFGRRIAKYRLDAAPQKRRPWQDAAAIHYSWDGNRLLLERYEERQSLYVYEPDSFVPLALVRSRHAAVPPQEDFPLPPEWQAFEEAHPEHLHNVEKLQRKARIRIGQDGDAEPVSLPSAEILYFHTDHLGTPKELTDREGHIVWSVAYRAWGRVAQIEHPPRRIISAVGNTATEHWQEQTDSVTQNLRFQGQYYDEESGLHYNRFRYYDPDCGRFISQDPIGLLGGANNYQYAPNPVSWIDPLGLNRFRRSTWGPCARGTGLAYIVFQQDIDWSLVYNGKTNLERAIEGGAPYIMKNGIPQQLQLHHSRQQSIGPLFEVTTSTHRAVSGRGREALHPYGNRKNPTWPVDREAFDKDRNQYWKDRAANAGC